MGSRGFGEKPVAGDINLDGVDDIVFWVPKPRRPVAQRGGRVLLPRFGCRLPIVPRPAVPAITRASECVFAPYSPAPLGNDLHSQFGDDFALPLFGNFDPPLGTSDQESLGSLTNEDNPLDTNVDGKVTARDALVVINALARGEIEREASPLRVVSAFNGFKLDASRDGTISALDALRVINGLAQLNLLAGGESSLAGETSQISWATSADSVIADLGDDDDELLALLAADRELEGLKF